jgi:hypothetical protein
MQFRNYYRCAECGCEWTDVWPAQCDDDCPWCGARHMSPYKSEDAESDCRKGLVSALAAANDFAQNMNQCMRSCDTMTEHGKW